MLRVFQRTVDQSALAPATAPPSEVNTIFPEEPLSLSGDQGCGFFLGRIGLLLNNGRYEILRKLGRGRYSNTWLVSDSRAPKKPAYYAVKILTVNATKVHQNGHLFELEIMTAVRDLGRRSALPYLFDHFEIEDRHGRHLCLVGSVLSTDVSAFRRSAPSERLGFRTVKIIIAQVLEALVTLHAAGIIHTDLRPENVLFCDGTSRKSIQQLLTSPPAVVGEFRLHGEDYPLIQSQPVPHPWCWNDPPTRVELYYVRLIDLGHAQWADREPTVISAYGLRPPEVILKANFDTKVDIWALGCMTFELLTGRWLFSPQSGHTEEHLAKMMELTGETFSEKLLSASQNKSEYFDNNGNLRRIDQLFPLSLEQAMMNDGLPKIEATPAAEFIRACLHLNPNERSSATDLVAHPWLKKAFMCC